jgi:glycosyltransferase involved in cell wall biosynthesis
VLLAAPTRIAGVSSVQNLSPIQTAVDVIIPCYNVESYLRRALESVFAQTYKNFQVYAVDDGSTDNTLNILQQNAQRCSYASQPYGGAAAARNCGIRMSNSPLIAFLDADDEWLANKLERQVEFMTRNPDFGLVCSLCEMRPQNAGTVFPLPGRALSGKLFGELVRSCFVFTPAVLVRRQCLEEVGLFDESLMVCEDFHLWLRIAARWKIAILPESLAVAHARPGSLSATISPEQRLRTGVATLEDVQARCTDLPGRDARALRRALAQRHYFYGSFLLSSGAKRRSRQSLLKALKLQPSHIRAFTKIVLSAFPARAIGSALAVIKMLKYRMPVRSVSPWAVHDSASH